MIATTETAILIRDIVQREEMHSVEELEKEVWGLPDLDVVPMAHLVAVRAAGGVLIGAFDGDTLIGFAYGFVGHMGGQPTHHSHLLAVKPAYRGFNLGYRLKLAQRERVLAQGIKVMTWTFDPLQSLNVHFNFNKLGVVSDRYLVNFYGEDAPSFLHRNGTDRLWGTWLLTSGRVNERLDKPVPAPHLGKIRPLVEIGVDNEPHLNNFNEALSHEQAAIEIPGDISALECQSIELAVMWREATRLAFTDAIAAGYMVTDFSRQNRDGQRLGTYLLTRGKRLYDFA